MIKLKRKYSQVSVLGVLTLPDGTELPTIELPWRNNRVGKSCIRKGIYKFVRDHTGKHRWWKILDVDGRTHIEIHEGYKPSHSAGCILMSRDSLVKMLEFFDGPETYILEII